MFNLGKITMNLVGTGMGLPGREEEKNVLLHKLRSLLQKMLRRPKIP